jgi:1-acyl-sn-glycerol-3-phosphate acyltransferase
MLRAIGCLCLFVAMAAVWSALAHQSPWRRRLELRFWRLLLNGFGIKARVHGEPIAGALLASNHISWIDIAALAGTCDASFVAKAEVASWPLIGALAGSHGCLFVERTRKIHARDHVLAASRQLERGRTLILFAEGTTSEGWDVLPFRSSLFQAVSGRVVQPVALAYRNPDGTAQNTMQRRVVAWVGDDALLPHALALAARGGAMIDIWFGPPLRGQDRKVLANASRAAIRARLAAVDDQAATLKR